VKSLVEKVRSCLPALDKLGAVYLFALFEREDATGKWDIVLSSEWSDKDATSANKFVSSQVVPLLDPEELASLSRVVVIPSTAPAIAAMSSAMNVDGGSVEVQDCTFSGLQIKHAFVFRCKRPISKSQLTEAVTE
jgi:hypothetical protein